MKVLFISRLFSGLETSIINDIWKPTGVPTIYKMIERFDLVADCLELIFTSKDGNTIWKNKKKITKKINGLRSSITVLPGAISFPKFIPKNLEYFLESYTIFYTLIFVIKK